MVGFARDAREPAPGTPAPPGRPRRWTRLDPRTRRSLALCGAVAALTVVLGWPAERWLADGDWDGFGVVLAFVLIWLVAPLGGGLLLGWPWFRVYGLAHDALLATWMAAEAGVFDRSSWTAWAQIVVLVAGLAAAGAVLRPAVLGLASLWRSIWGDGRDPGANGSGVAGRH